MARRPAGWTPTRGWMVQPCRPSCATGCFTGRRLPWSESRTRRKAIRLQVVGPVARVQVIAARVGEFEAPQYFSCRSSIWRRAASSGRRGESEPADRFAALAHVMRLPRFHRCPPPAGRFSGGVGCPGLKPVTGRRFSAPVVGRTATEGAHPPKRYRMPTHPARGAPGA